MYTRLNKKFKGKVKITKQDWTKRFDIEPIEGYQEHTNIVTGERFPYCCDPHKLLYENLIEICDEPHLAHLPEKIINQLVYTEYFIIKRINNDDWYKDITDYIIYNYASFAPPAHGVLLYLKLIMQLLEQSEAYVPVEKRKSLIEFLESWVNEEKWPKWGAQLQILHTTYQRWLKLFPFELTSYFKDLGKYYNKTLPYFYVTERDYNPYLKTFNPQIHTKASLIELLMKLTNEILTFINGAMLLENGYVGNADLVKFELVINSRKQKLKNGYNNSLEEDEIKINHMIEEWFEDEKRFFTEITPLMQSLPIPKPEKKASGLQIKQIALIHVYENLNITRKNADVVAQRYNYAAKNSGEKLFQEYTVYCSPLNRKGKPTPCTPKKLRNKIELFKSIVEYLSDRAKPRALDEIKILETIYESEFT